MFHSTAHKISKFTCKFLALIFMLLGANLVFSVNDAYAQTKIEITVNSGVITTYQITQRSRFLRLTGFKGDNVAEARKQLIREELQLQEAKRVNFSLSDSDVESAYERLARGNGTTPAVFSQALRQRGVNPDTLKQLIKARILWQRIVTARARAETNRAKQATDITSILFNKNGNGENRLVKEYTIEQFVFLVKGDATDKQAQQRLREVEAFRRSNASCSSAIQSATNLAASGVVTKSLGRFTSDTLPAQMREDILEAGDALFTKPKRRAVGIELLAICKTREIVDNTATGALNIDVGKLDTKELEEKLEQWLKDLEQRAKIRNL